MIHLNNMNPSATFFTASLGAVAGKNISPTFSLLDDPDFFSLLKNAHPKPDTFLVHPLFGTIPDRLPHALKMEQLLSDENEFVRKTAIQVLGKIIPDLEPADRLWWVGEIEKRLEDIAFQLLRSMLVLIKS